MNMILLGPPGAGKGTQADALVGRYKGEHVSTGNIFRNLIKQDTPLGIKVRKYVESGELIPDSIVAEVVTVKIKSIDLKKGFILDGFPRTLVQARILEDVLKDLGARIDVVFYFETEEGVIVKRLSGRRICGDCGVNYHIVNMPPAKEGICDKCGGGLYQRKDDEAETVRNRLKVYKKQTLDLIEYYRQKGILETVNGGLSKEGTFKEIESRLEGAGRK